MKFKNKKENKTFMRVDFKDSKREGNKKKPTTARQEL